MRIEPAKMRKAITKALQIARDSGQVDGSHHKAWVIDQMVRALTGCPIIELRALDSRKKPYTYKAFGNSELYEKFIKMHNDGEEGPDTYSWEEGIPP
jgi:hypothetical protein